MADTVQVRLQRRTQARLFAALGDETRLALLAQLGGGEARSITQLTEGSRRTRQAVTKHLRVLEAVRLVHARREGRESLYTVDPAQVMELGEHLRLVAEQWEGALARLKAFAETQ